MSPPRPACVQPTRVPGLTLAAFLLYTVALVSAEPYPAFRATIESITESIDEQTITCEQLTRQYISRIQRFDAPTSPTRLHLMITTDYNNALDQAKALDTLIQTGSTPGRLHCVPVIAKDVFDARTYATTAGSEAMKDVYPKTDSPIIAKMRLEGAVILGKANVAEWGDSKINTRSTVAGQAHNPYAPQRTVFGSSGGTSAAIAAGFGVIGLGADGAGAILSPASGANLFGLRPGPNVLDHTGVLPSFPLTDVPGVMTRTVKDLAETMVVLTDDKSYLDALRRDDRVLPTLRLAYVPDFVAGSSVQVPGEGRIFTGASSEVKTVFDESLGHLRVGGLTVSSTRSGLSDLLQVMTEMASLDPSCAQTLFADNLDAYLSNLGSKSPMKSIKDLIASGRLGSSFQQKFVQYDSFRSTSSPECSSFEQKRIQLHNILTREMNAASADFLVFPTMPDPPFLLDQLAAANEFTASVLSAYAGWPAINIPGGFTLSKLPVGITVLGVPGSESKLIRIARRFEESRVQWRYPPGTPPLHSEFMIKFQENIATIDDVHWALVSNLTTCHDFMKALQIRLRTFDKEVKAIVSQTPKKELDIQARELDSYYKDARGFKGPLHCIPIVLSDVINSDSLVTTAGTKALANNRPPANAEAIRNLQAAGAILIGKGNVADLALSTSNTYSSVLGQTINVYDKKLTIFGSGGGTAAALAAGYAVVGIGNSATSGIHGPASASNVYSFRPEFAALSTNGVFGLSKYTDTVGPVARSAIDLAVAMDTMTGGDVYRSASLPSSPNVVIGTVTPFDSTVGFTTVDETGKARTVEMDEQVRSALGVALGHFNRRDVPTNKKVDLTQALDTVDTMRAVHRDCMLQSGAGALQDYLNSLGPEAKIQSPSTLRDAMPTGDRLGARAYLDKIIAQASSTAPACQQFLQLRTTLRSQLASAMSSAGVSALIYPTYLAIPFALANEARQKDDVYDTGAVSAFSGLPSIGMPGHLVKGTGAGEETIPVGVTLLGGPGSDTLLFQLASVYDESAPPFVAPSKYPSIGIPDETMEVGEIVGVSLGSFVFMAFLLFLLSLLYSERTRAPKKQNVGGTLIGGRR